MNHNWGDTLSFYRLTWKIIILFYDVELNWTESNWLTELFIIIIIHYWMWMVHLFIIKSIINLAKNSLSFFAIITNSLTINVENFAKSQRWSWKGMNFMQTKCIPLMMIRFIVKATKSLLGLLMLHVECVGESCNMMWCKLISHDLIYWTKQMFHML